MAIGEGSTAERMKGVRSFCIRRCGLCAAAALAVVGLFFVWRASLLAFGTLSLPGPGFFPFVLGVLLVTFSAGIAFELWRRPATGEKAEFGHHDVLITVAAMLGAALLFETLGALLTLGLFAFGILVLVGRMHALRAAIAATAGMVAVWYFFKVLLGLQLPSGLL